MTYYTPDYTGTDILYARTNDPYTLFESGQTIVFDVPIYSNSLKITTLDKNPVPLDEGVDYEFQPSDVDTTTMSRAKNADMSFDQQLVKSVTITRDASLLPVKVMMSYQQFYCTTPTAPVSAQTGTIDVTPDLMIDLIRRVGVCEQQTSIISDNAGIPTSYPNLLSFDINGVNQENIVSNEEWTVNTFSNQKVIRPLQGSFFKNSVTITANNQPLTPGVDFLILGINSAFTKLTTNTSGVFDLILITKPYAGTVKITYHAVGGDVTTTSVQSLYDNLYAVKSFLEASSFLTPDALQDVSAFKQIQNTVKSLEENMRVLLSGTSAKYGDTTNGTAIVKSIRANDTQMHWWNIATLYQVSGSSDIVVKDRMSLHIELVSNEYMADVDVAFDMNNADHPVTITARNVVMDPGFTLFGDVSNLTGVYPCMRVIWNKTSDNVSGAILQFGAALPGLSDSLAIEDRSGVESAWLLNTDVGSTDAPLTPSDNAVLLPDNATTWSSTGGASLSVAQTLQNTTGYLLTATSTLLSEMDDSVGAPASFTSSLPAYFRYTDITSVDVYTTDANNRVVKTSVPMYPALGSTTTVSGSAPIQISSTKDVGVISVTLAPSSDGASYSVTTRIFGTTTLADALALRYVIARI